MVARMSTIMLTAGRGTSLPSVSTKPHGFTGQERSCTWRLSRVSMLGFSCGSDGRVLGNRGFSAGECGKESHMCWCQRVPGGEEEETDVSETDLSQDVASGIGSSAQVSGCKNFVFLF